jgi:adenine-specific DNA-methyltransferase
MTRNLIEAYYSVADAKHRREHGQFFTPFEVAAFMCRWALSAGSTTLYDPAFGLGSFYFAAKKSNSSIHFSGNEVDAKILDFFRSHNNGDNRLILKQQDYLLSWGQKHNAIVCNPPYMRFQKFLNRSEVFSSFQQRLGYKLSGYTNIASAFLLKSIHELAPNGRLAYIMPLEFLNTGYGSFVKQRLIENGLLKAIITLEAEKDVFPDVTTTTGIILAVNDLKKEPVCFYTVRNMTELDNLLALKPNRQIPQEELDPSEKWLKHFDAKSLKLDSSSLVSVRYYGAFSRGIATGANEFFVLSSGKARELSIPRSLLIPCITKSAQIKTAVFTNEDLRKLEESDANVFLLNVNGEMSAAVAKYLQYGEQLGYNQRYLTKVRNPWFKLERRTPASLLFGVFSRDSFKVIRNYSKAINLTCYHCFYPNLFGRPFVDRLFLYFQSQSARKILSLSLRRYGDSLDKFEPNDLNEALAPSPSYLDAIPIQLVNESMDRCAKGLPIEAKLQKIFESLIKTQGIHYCCENRKHSSLSAAATMAVP